MRVLSSKAFASSSRLRGLLNFLAEETLAGRAGRLKEYAIAVDLFGRDADFDPRIDACVRNEIWRLRSRLEHYYLGEGAANPLRIELPRRSFQVATRRLQRRAFEPMSTAPAAIGSVGSVGNVGTVGSVGALRLQLQAFELHGEPWHERHFGKAVADELALELANHPNVELVVAGASHEGGLWVVEGAVHRHGARLRAMVRIVDPLAARQVWAHAIDDIWTDALDMQQRLAADIVDAFLEGAARTRIGWQPMAETPTVDDVLRRMLYFDVGPAIDGGRTLSRRVRQLRARLRLHPEDVSALGDMALTLSGLVNAQPQVWQAQWPELRAAALRAARLDPAAIPHALVALGMASQAQHDWHYAEQVLQRAVAQCPEYPAALLARGMCLLMTGRAEQGCSDIARARDIEPRTAFTVGTLGFARYYVRDYEGAALHARAAIAIDGDFEPAYLLLADAELDSGRVKQALARLDEAARLPRASPIVIGRLGYACAIAGQRRRAQELLDELQGASAPAGRVSAAISEIHLGLGNMESAFDGLEDAMKRHAIRHLALMRGAARYDPVRTHPRFTALVSGMGLPLAA